MNPMKGEQIKIISAHGVGDKNQIFIWRSEKRRLLLYYLFKANKNILQFKKVTQYFGNHSKISQPSLPKLILCAAENNEIVLFSIIQTDHLAEVNYERCNKEWFNSNNSMADDVANVTVADAALISCRLYEEGDSCRPSIRVHTWFYHCGTMVFYVLKHASNNALIYKQHNLCPFTATELNGQMKKIERALNIEMTLPQFLLKVDGDIVSKFDLKFCDKYEVVYEKRKENEELIHDIKDKCVNMLVDMW